MQHLFLDTSPKFLGTENSKIKEHYKKPQP